MSEQKDTSSACGVASELNDLLERGLTPCPFCGAEARIEVMVRDDFDKYPRPHWHAKCGCTSCFAATEWESISRQLADNEPYSMEAILTHRLGDVIASWNVRSNAGGNQPQPEA